MGADDFPADLCLAHFHGSFQIGLQCSCLLQETQSLSHIQTSFIEQLIFLVDKC